MERRVAIEWVSVYVALLDRCIPMRSDDNRGMAQPETSG